MAKVHISRSESLAAPLFWIAQGGVLRVSQGYPYTKLESNRHFRLLTLFSKSFRPLLANIFGPDSFYLCGTLSTHDLDQNVSYECLSYVWGESDASTCPLLYLDEHVIRISENLSLALQRLRLEDKPRTLWVDFVCINQGDHKEREQQVGIMYQIFSQASRVVGYLGDNADGSEHIPQLIIDIEAAHFQDLDDRPPRPDCPPPAWTEEDCVRLGLPPAGDVAWSRLEKFISRPWFRRIWIIQEALAARKLVFVCGNWHYPATGLFYGLLTAFYRRLPLARSWRETMIPYGDGATSGYQQIFLLLRLGVCGIIAKTGGAKQEPWPLVHILTESRSANATDSRDRIFALLNICADQDQLGLVPNYSESYTETCRRVAQSLVRAGYGNIIVCIKSGLETKLKLPSWVPDWSLRKSPSIAVAPDPDVVNTSRLDYECCAGGNIHDIKLGANINELLLEAHAIDVVYALDNDRETEKDLPVNSSDARYDKDYRFFCLLGNVKESETPNEEEIQMLRNVNRYLADAKYWVGTSPRYSHCDRMEILWRTLTTNQELGSPYKAPASYHKYCRAYYNLVERFSRTTPQQNNDGVSWTQRDSTYDSAVEDGLTANMPKEMDTQVKQALVFVRTVLQGYSRPRPALTRTGFVVMVPPAALPGDVISVIKGVRAPMALRPVLGDARRIPSRYELLGPCYFHGFMNGEVLESDEHKSENIVLV